MCITRNSAKRVPKWIPSTNSKYQIINILLHTKMQGKIIKQLKNIKLDKIMETPIADQNKNIQNEWAILIHVHVAIKGLKLYNKIKYREEKG